MSQLTLTVLQLGFLVVLWVLVIAVVRVLRRDLYGTRVVARTAGTTPKEGRRAKAEPPAPAPAPMARQAPRTPPAPTRLTVTEGSLRGTTISLGQAAVLIGRAPECTLVLTDDFASGRHARLSRTDRGWVVEDLGSTNGTQLDGRPLTTPTAVAAGAQLRIGRTVIELGR